MDLNIVEFFIDESKNFLASIVNKIGSKKLNKMYYNYLDYYELNLPVYSFNIINYVAITIPILICLIFYFMIIIFITKNMLNFYLQKKKYSNK